jgi:hypothetical protein
METEAAMKIENRQKFLLIVTIVVVALYAGDLVVFEPLGKWWKARANNIIKLTNDVKHGTNLLANADNIRSKWTYMFTNTLPNTLPNDKALAQHQVLGAFNEWAQKSGASLTGVSSQWKNDSTNYLTLNCRVEASGTIATLGAFLYDIEKGLYKIGDIEKGPMALKLDSVQFSAHDNTGQQLTLVMQISGLALASSQTK